MNSHDPGVSLTDKKRLTAGQVLSERREKLGLTVEECADTLKLSVSKVKALEADNDVPFQSEIFQRGYLKSYAKLVDLPVNDVLYYYDSQRQGSNVKIESAASDMEGKPNKKWWLPYMLAVLIVFTWFFLSNEIDLDNAWESSSFISEPSLTPQPEIGEQPSQTGVLPATALPSVGVNALSAEASPVLAEQAKAGALQQIEQEGNASQALIEGGDTVPPVTGSVVPVATEGNETLKNKIQNDTFQKNNIPQPLSLDSTTGVQTDGVSLADAQLEQGDLQQALTSEASLVNDLLYFTFLEVCWVQVVDSTNKTIISSVRRANSDLLVEGRSPFSVIFGNINGATLRFNDKPIDLVNSPDGRTLRLTVGG